MRVEEACGEDKELLDGIMGLLENRAAIHKPVKTVRAVNGILKDLSVHSGGSRRTALAMLGKAIKNNWLTVYPLKADELTQTAGGQEKEEYGWQM